MKFFLSFLAALLYRRLRGAFAEADDSRDGRLGPGEFAGLREVRDGLNLR
jgi:hypothetical protein